MSAEEPYTAEVVKSSSAVTREFNLVLGGTVALSLVFLILSMSFSQVFVNEAVQEEEISSVRVDVWDRYKLPYETTGEFGVALEEGPYELLPTENQWLSLIHI